MPCRRAATPRAIGSRRSAGSATSGSAATAALRAATPSTNSPLSSSANGRAYPAGANGVARPTSSLIGTTTGIGGSGRRRPRTNSRSTLRSVASACSMSVSVVRGGPLNHEPVGVLRIRRIDQPRGTKCVRRLGRTPDRPVQERLVPKPACRLRIDANGLVYLTKRVPEPTAFGIQQQQVDMDIQCGSGIAACELCRASRARQPRPRDPSSSRPATGSRHVPQSPVLRRRRRRQGSGTAPAGSRRSGLVERTQDEGRRAAGRTATATPREELSSEPTRSVPCRAPV